MSRRLRRSSRTKSKAADSLKAWLKVHGKTQEWLADTLDVGRSTVWAWMGGRNHPSLELAASIQALTGGAVEASAWVDPKEIARVVREADIDSGETSEKVLTDGE